MAFVWAARLLQLSIFALGVVFGFAVRDGSWGWAVAAAVMAGVAYLMLTWDISDWLEEEEE